ncbi:MAG: type IV pilus modification protein PilV [Gammaproteobacteria bacterium]|nr:MAG: type IV pilus modification protein PilV [Gammaproteobacteria bacterium]
MRMTQQRGFSMIEVLVALVILAVGLLGVATMQSVSLQASKNANLRSVAIFLASDMADRMRANQAGWQAGNYNTEAGGAKKTNCISTAGCDPADMAAHDKWEWKQLIESTLPAGKGTISRPDPAANDFVITVSWTDKVRLENATGAKVDTDTSSVVLNFQP